MQIDSEIGQKLRSRGRGRDFVDLQNVYLAYSGWSHKSGTRVAADHMRVLIIDDEANIRRITAVALEGMGHQTSVAEDGNDALRQLEATDFDAAFLDLKLHGENGIELLPKLLASRPDLDVIVFSAGATAESAKAAQQAGAAGFMAKPFTVEQIRQALGNLPGGGPRPQAG